MAVSVYAWPPISAVGSEWTENAPINVSTSLITGRRYVSAAMRKRRLATIVTSSLATSGQGAGYVEALKRFLAGGENLVRLNAYPVNWHLLPTLSEFNELLDLEWNQNLIDLQWDEAGTSVLWSQGTSYSATYALSSNLHNLTVTGLPANIELVRPGDVVRVYLTDSTDGEIIMAATPASSNGSGVAVIRLVQAPTIGTVARATFGVPDSAVFAPDLMPRAIQPVQGDWSYTWNFTEVFEDEVDGGFLEIDPWV